MGVQNKLIKFIGYIMVYVVAFIENYLLSVLIMGSLASLVFAVWSFITPVPAFVASHYGIMLILGSLPLGIVLMIYVLIQAKKK